MAHHCPVVAAPLGGVLEMVLDGVSGFLVAPWDCRKLSERILSLESQPLLRKEIAERAFKEVQKLEAREWVRNMEKIYTQKVLING